MKGKIILVCLLIVMGSGQTGPWTFQLNAADSERSASLGDRAVLQFATGKQGDLAGTAVLEKLDADSYSWELIDITLDGKKIPDWPNIWQRQ